MSRDILKRPLLERFQLIDEFTMASEGHSLAHILAIRAVEQVSSRPHLKRLYADYQKAVQSDVSFWESLVQRLGLKLDFHGSHYDALPKEGPLVVVANHPFGILDGLIICWLVSRQRQDFKIMINHVMTRLPEMQPHILPVNFDKTPDALETNLESRKAAKKHLESGGALIMFPAGGIATTPHFFSSAAVEPKWGALLGKLLKKAEAPVLPVFFGGQNSQLFQKVSHISYAARWALLFHEVNRRRGSDIDLVVGEVMAFSDLPSCLPPKELAMYLRHVTHDLSRRIKA